MARAIGKGIQREVFSRNRGRPGCGATRESVQRLAGRRRATSGRWYFSRPGDSRSAHRFRSVVGFYVCSTDDQAATLAVCGRCWPRLGLRDRCRRAHAGCSSRSEEHTSELQSQSNLVCRLLLEKKKNNKKAYTQLY